MKTSLAAGSKRLSIIVITWNQVDLTKNCLQTLLPIVNLSDDEVIVIDNGSVDGTGEMVANEFPMVLYHRVPENLGVGPARNRGVALSSGRYLMTLDNDAQPAAANLDLGTLIEGIFRAHPAIGLFGFKLLNTDGTLQRNARRFPLFIHPLIARIPASRKIPFLQKEFSRHMMEDVAFDDLNEFVEVDYVIGANQIFRRAVLGDTEAYDPNIFYGPEDYEFCLRLRRAGWHVGWSPAFRFMHEYKRITRKLSRITVKFLIAHVYVFAKYRTFWRLNPAALRSRSS